MTEGGPAILVTVLEVWGSAPREAGVAMLVWVDRTLGTIGGGNLEWRAMQAAHEMLAAGATRRTLALPLGPTLAQCCGGQVALELELIDAAGQARFTAAHTARGPDLPQVAIFGAGHVGRALVAALAPLPCRVDWLDGRAGIFPDDLPEGVTTAVSLELAARAAALPHGSHVLVMTHSHPLDLEIVEAALRRDDLPYVGLIGSLTKRRRFESQLRACGIAPARLAQLVCPIGIAGIEGKSPPVIAAAVAAQLLIAFEAQAARAALRGAA